MQGGVVCKVMDTNRQSTVSYSGPLSRWWQTKSCQEAYERAAVKRQERIAKLQAEVAQRKADLEQAVLDWEVQS